MKHTHANFEQQRQQAIDVLKALHFDNDPHFVVIAGNHEASDSLVCSCPAWSIVKCSEVIEKVITKAQADGLDVTLDEGT